MYKVAQFLALLLVLLSVRLNDVDWAIFCILLVIFLEIKDRGNND